jgi:transposase
MPRHAPVITLTTEEASTLKTISNSRAAEFRQVERAKIILACATGMQNKQIAKELGVTLPTVAKWRKRFIDQGLPGLRDAERSGKPLTYGTDFRDRLFSLIDKDPPAGMARWDCPSLAEKLGGSTHAVWRLLRKEGIYLHRSRSWCISTDPEFASKAANIVGLYLNPPVNALILSVDEKPSIQAIERETGLVETRDKKVYLGYKSTYKRHGTLNLFAALNVATGYVHIETTAQKKREDFQEFLGSVISDLPENKEIHVILDNYSTHKKNDEWLEKNFKKRVSFHFTPTSASWLNQIEIWFGILSRKTLNGASFADKESLIAEIKAFTAKHNENPSPFKWKKREVHGSQLRNTIKNFRN